MAPALRSELGFFERHSQLGAYASKARSAFAAALVAKTRAANGLLGD